jgi:hypothetical protein
VAGQIELLGVVEVIGHSEAVRMVGQIGAADDSLHTFHDAEVQVARAQLLGPRIPPPVVDDDVRIFIAQFGGRPP